MAGHAVPMGRANTVIQKRPALQLHAPLLTALFVLIAAPVALSAQNPKYRTTQSDFGGTGLLQTPTARMAPEGDISFNATRVDPYSRYSISAQPLPWLEGTIRYTSVSNRRYGAESFSGDQSFKDKGIDAKVRLLKESYWYPQVAFGMRDLGGTGLFSSEYFVANKRVYNFDFSLGLAWGYIGNRGGIDNPLGLLNDKFDTRGEVTTDVSQAGGTRTNSYFRGPLGVFGGIEYQSPWEKLRFKVELDGNDYKSEPQGNDQPQEYPVNFGALYRLSDGIDLTAAWERGNTAMFGITLHTNLKAGSMPQKVLDPAPEARKPLPTGVSGNAIDWSNVSQRLRSNAGIEVQEISLHGDEVIVTGEQKMFRDSAKGLGRAARVLDNSLGEGSYNWYTLVYSSRGMPISQTSINAEKLREYERNEIDRQALRRATANAVPAVLDDDIVYTGELDKTDFSTNLGYTQNVGGPDNFLLYQFLLRFDGAYYFERNKWLHGSLGVNLLNNYDQFEYDAPSNLPRVRTDIRQYMTTSDVQLSHLQYTQTKQLDRDLYGMAYAGLFESMYGGVGGELLYRPYDANWALGVDANWVKQRDYDQRFGFRDYSTLTGHVTGYLQTGFYNILAKGSVGRYLAGDYGGTLDLSRRFNNGVSIGGWATLTNVSKEEYGEGSFDKGIYVSFPFDAFFVRSTTSTGTIAWNPLTRDGGARLNRYYQLYNFTSDRDLDHFNDGFGSITE
ncbi:Exopolysaccharide biosynthesis protein YbjH [Halopseudomonas sabulinigri]|uniref:Exopolysaccharide biosynthesis protein YbjH n=1 Tax=Halopseudomonas sabulinigri TaxID=472181 RepID=A0A1H1L8V1_9GAMM|nr:YjbH domain-containing protein [Halopseudomonas sabulinigri]SDR70319.1 Exopolysaccharide biosynthesis protein YbjH [Halopseudomonas sabulinigri]